MLNEYGAVLDTLQGLSEEDYYEILEALAKVRLTNVSEFKNHRKLLNSINSRYLEERQKIIGQDNLIQHRSIIDQYNEAIRSAEKKMLRTPEGIEEFERLKLEYKERFQKQIDIKNVDWNKLTNLRKSCQHDIESAFFETIGKGEQSSTQTGTLEKGDSDDDEIFPPYWDYVFDLEGPGTVNGSVDRNTGLLGASIECKASSWHNDPAYDNGLVRYGWVVYGDATHRAGNFRGTIDLQIQQCFSVAYVHDHPRFSCVSINCYPRVFAQMIHPFHSIRYYAEMLDNRILPSWNPNWGGGGAFPKFYLEDEWSVDSLLFDARPVPDYLFGGEDVGNRTRRYSITIPTIFGACTFAALIGIEIYSSVWANDCSVYRSFNCEFTTPRITWEIVH